MVQRSYNQYCPIAHALDLVGERWSLLIVRDLLLGPKRFSDLREGLPGIGTNILSDRLRGLEQGGVIARRVLPPPAASAVYELTEYGRALDGPIQTLAAWGGQSLGPIAQGQALSRDSLLLTARALAARLLALAGVERVAFELAGDPPLEASFVRAAGGAAALEPPPAAAADLSLQLDTATLFAIAGGARSLAEALREGALRLQGRPEALALLDGA